MQLGSYNENLNIYLRMLIKLNFLNSTIVCKIKNKLFFLDDILCISNNTILDCSLTQ